MGRIESTEVNFLIYVMLVLALGSCVYSCLRGLPWHLAGILCPVFISDTVLATRIKEAMTIDMKCS